MSSSSSSSTLTSPTSESASVISAIPLSELKGHLVRRPPSSKAVYGTLLKRARRNSNVESTKRKACATRYSKLTAILQNSPVVDVAVGSTPITSELFLGVDGKKLSYILNEMTREDLRILHEHNGCLDSIMEMIGRRDTIARAQNELLTKIQNTQVSIDSLLDRISELERSISQHNILTRYKESLRMPNRTRIRASGQRTRNSSLATPRKTAHRTKNGDLAGGGGFDPMFMGLRESSN